MKSNNGILIFAELNNNQIHPVSYELCCKGRELADKTGSRLFCLVLGGEGIDVRELIFHGADEVFYIKGDCFTHPEEYLFKENIVPFLRKQKPEILLIGATAFGRSIAPRIAAAMKTGLTADCTDLRIDAEGRLIQVRPAFSNHILAHIKTKTYPQIATVRYKEFSKSQRIESRSIHVTVLEPFVSVCEKNTITRKFTEEDFDITEAQVVVAGGRGIKRKEDLMMLRRLSDLLGGELGVSRALVDAGMAGSSRQIGYSGNRVKPRLYIACGISGAPQHIAGMKESSVIIAINNDPSAPIFKYADYGYVGNLYEIVPRMIKDLESMKARA